MQYKDYYEILGVAKDASQEEIKKTYRRLARKHHPDVDPSEQAQERFKDINEAYEVLSDPEKRQKYDRLGADYKRWERMGGGPQDFDWGQWAAGPGGQRVHVRRGSPEDLEDIFGGMGGFSDFFQSIFGGMGAGSGTRTWTTGGPQMRQRQQPGRDLEHGVEITLEEAYQGTSRLLQKDSRRLEVDIPPGVKTGSKVRISGEGAPSPAGGGSGDLYLKVKVRPHRRFERRGDDLYVEVPVDLYTAVLGGEVRVPTLEGDVMLKIPPETSSGKTLRLTGKGMPNLRNPDQHGDLYAEVQIQVPQDLSDREIELFKELSEAR